MFRTLLALCLALSAAVALATETPPADTPTPGCIKVEREAGTPVATGDGKSAAAARPGTPAPVRPRTGNTRGGPRWHSMLPGMIR